MRYADQLGRPMDFNLNDALAVLEATPPTLATLLSGHVPDLGACHRGRRNLEPVRCSWAPDPRRTHGLDSSRSPHPRRGCTFLRALRSDCHVCGKPGKRLNKLLETFAQLRAENLAELRVMRLSHTELERTGQHPELGVVTLRQLLATWVVHDLDHVGQIARVMAKAYGDEVGPWRAYVSILNDRRR